MGEAETFGGVQPQEHIVDVRRHLGPGHAADQHHRQERGRHRGDRRPVEQQAEHTAAAFLSTSSGLVVSLAGVLFTDVLRGRWKDFRLAAVVSAVLPIAMALTVPRLDLGLTVPLVFAVAASTFCPLLELGIWWRRLTARGAAAGVLVGGVLSTAASPLSLFAQLPPDLLGLLVQRPAIVTVPAAFLTMVLVSRMSKAEVPSDVDAVLLRMHAPERLGLTQDRG